MTDFAERRRVMVDTQIRPSDVTKFPVIDAMLSVPRENFVPDVMRAVAYAEEMIELEPGRVIVEPRTLGKMLDMLDIQPTESMLLVGGGLGYSAAVAAHLAQLVVAVEDNETRAQDTLTALSDAGADNAIVHDAALTEGAAEHGPYDLILIEGGVEEVPAALLDQLKDGGRIASIFMAGALGEVRLGHKADGRITWRFAFNATAPVLPGFFKAKTFSL
ncbi:MAG: protein-L-isoaspartate O-methyltransferase [Rhodobacteraceae bacterium]|nr:protein-L-isoaspartate O-methyltransferase [Paracoccaceae bacterium]